MEEIKVFYSWQSNLDPQTHRFLIRGCINTVLKRISNPEIHYSLDESTLNIPGTPEIIDSILTKIDQSSIFIADLSPIIDHDNTLIPNPNVLFELGYAFKALESTNILCVIDEDRLKNTLTLPFDISHRRYIPYKSSYKDCEQKLTHKLNDAIKCITQHTSFLQKLSILKDHGKRDFDIISDVLLDCNFDALDVFFEMARIRQMRNDILIYWEGFYRKIDSTIFILDNKELELEFKKFRTCLGNFLNSIEDAEFNCESHVYHIKKFYSSIPLEIIYKYLDDAQVHSKRIAELLHAAFPSLNLAESNKKAFINISPFFYD